MPNKSYFTSIYRIFLSCIQLIASKKKQYYLYKEASVIGFTICIYN